MTRAELLTRLTNMALSGEDMSLPVVVKVRTTIYDARFRHKLRHQDDYYKLMYCCSGSTTIPAGTFGELASEPFLTHELQQD